jgi:hypothetical protein
MLDPGLEHLHRHQRVWRLSTERRRLLRELVSDVALVIPMLVLLLVAPRTPWGDPLVVAALVVAVAGASLVRFDIASGSTSPLHVVQVALWYVVPPAWLPIVVGAAFILGGLVERLRSDPGTPLWTVLLSGVDAWPAVAPATVFAIFGPADATLDAFWLFGLAFIAEAALGVLLTIAFNWFNHGLRPRVIVGTAVWVVAIDGALAPIGFLGAVTIAQEPFALLALLPLVLVLGEFARERRDRIDQALQLSSAYRGTAQLMGDVLEADDAYTGGEHTQGVVELAVAVGLELRLPPREMRDLEFGALLHDIGKLRVPNAIINKPSGLSEAEWVVMRQHPIHGQEMLDRVGGALADAGRIVRAHHERWDGTGYPDGLEGDAIPVAARIITVCDSLSAMTTRRSYSEARTYDEALDELDRCSGAQFDPAVVNALKRVIATEQALGSGETSEIPAAARALGLRRAA